ncbi:MAG: glycerophosphodiester phosphodiesterase [Chloroflexi bacterium]|nr:glycerophosphodiester phosphodiesterase [Chloroflexota bacterium]MCI0574616.1 glycerophosphodiester phosphodiesterase [Chloroflexota bacterium]MCI0644032.1 glycerophosphodiester phosphodiesterase [Chloroflexota bacterium]MCI0731706.1 glycerophosphodiester phosphodiesterase [Chloroflexota bacterium]
MHRLRQSRLIRVLLVVVAILMFLYGALALLARPAPDHIFFTQGPARPLVIAHQGGDGLWPGDTLYAFERAAGMGVDVLEMDVHSTADGALVLMHDDTVDRTTDGAGKINSLTLDELKSLDAGYDWSPDGGQSFPYRGQGITAPTLEEIFTTFPSQWMVIEIKQVEPPIVEPLCQMIRQYGLADRALVASFHKQTMAAFRTACPEVATSAAEDEIRPFFILNTLFLGALHSPPAHAFQVPEYSGSLHVLTPRFVRGAHGRNLEVHAWTINETADMQRMLDLGIDGIITDYPDRLLELLDR